MGEIHMKQRIDHPAAEVWEWLRDFENIHRIHPAIGRTSLDRGPSCGVGAVRTCEMKLGGYHLKERVIDWKEGESYTVDVFETSFPILERSLTTFGVRATGPDACEVRFDAAYSTKFGAFGRAMDALVMNAMMKRMIRNLFRELDRTLAGAARASHEAAA